MLTSPEPDRNIEELNDDEIYASIRYLEPDPTSAIQNGDIAPTKPNDDNSAVVCICLYIAVLGCLAVFWLYLR